jgi:hypothetical protein
MKFEDLHGGQIVAIVVPYNGLRIGLKGTIIGAYKSEEKALVELFNRQKTQEKIPLKNIIGVLYNEDE